LDVAPKYAAILMGISNTVGTIPGIICPSLTGAIVVERTPEEWRTVFLITAGVYAMGALLYGILASGDKQDWADGESQLLDVEKEKSEFYPNTEKDLNGYGATADNGQYKGYGDNQEYEDDNEDYYQDQENGEDE